MKSIISIISILSLGLLIQCQADIGAYDILEGLGTGHEELGVGLQELEIEEIMPGLIEESVKEPNYIIEEDVFPLKTVEFDLEIVNEEEIQLDVEGILTEELKEIVREEDNMMEEIEEEQVEEKAILENILEKQREEEFRPIQVFIAAPNANMIPAEHKDIQALHEGNEPKFTLDTMRLIFFVSAGVLTLFVFLLLIMLLVNLIRRVNQGSFTAPRYRYLSTGPVKKVSLIPSEGINNKAFLP